MSKLDDLIAEVSVTKRLVSIATDRAGLTALMGGPGPDGQPGGGSYSYACLATTVQAAAAGLTWRGLRPRDVVGVLAPDVVGFTLAMHAVRAAGGVPSPVDSSLCAVETAGQLAESGARMVITAPPLADTALAAVDRSWVRQVFSFVDAPGATRFSDLLGLDMIRPSRGRPDDVALLPFTRGQDGRLRPAPVSHRELFDLVDKADQGAGITSRDVVLALPPAGDGLEYAALIDSALLRGATVCAVRKHELTMAAATQCGTVVVVPKDAGIAVPGSARVIPVG
jgi:acyl-CoA synthetase (AMP-forming)/AMP-acid ligase II